MAEFLQPGSPAPFWAILRHPLVKLSGMRARKTQILSRRGEIHPFREVWLLGQPPLQSYLRFVEEMVVDGAKIPKSTLVDEWRAANDYYGELEQSEAGFADKAEIQKLDKALVPLARAVKASPQFKRAFDTLPTRIEMVQLDRLIVSQKCISLHHTDAQKTRLGPAPNAKDVFRFCLPLERAEAPVRMRKTGAHRYVYWSESADFRFQEAAHLRPNQISGFTPSGAVGGIIGLMVGYDSNFLNCVQSESRLLLQDGHHRAYALRDLGITHAPCIIQTVSRLDELKLVAGGAVLDDPGFYFTARRPPVLKDFFDPKIRKNFAVHPAASVVEISFEVREYTTRDFAKVE